MNAVQIQSFTDPATQYEVTDDGHGHYECSCPDFVNRRAGTGTYCKHIRKYLEDVKVVIKDGKEYVRNEKGKLVSKAQYDHLKRARLGLKAPQKPAATAATVPVLGTVEINTDAIALIDMLNKSAQLPRAIEALKSRLVAGHESSFNINVPAFHTLMKFVKRRGWSVEIIQY